MKTSVQGIYAGGDCATVMHKILQKPVYIPLGTNANKQGRLIADAILEKDVKFYALGTAMMRCLNLELAKTGVTQSEAQSAGINAKVTIVQTKTHARYFPHPSPITIKLCFEEATRVLLGAQLMGENECAWRINVLACAINCKMSARDLGFLDLGYAPPFASVWDAIQIAANSIK